MTIQISDITNSNSTGIFDKLMEAVNAHINDQYLNNRITGSDYANVYLSSIQAVLQQAIQYGLQEQLVEAQIADISAGVLLKNAELDRLKNTTEAELEKQWGYDVTRDAEDNLVLGASTGLGKIDKDISAVERQITDQELTSSKQRDLMDIDAAIKQYENTVLQVDQHNVNLGQVTKLQEEIDILQSQDLDVQAGTAIKTQQKLTEIQNTAKVAYEVSTLLPDQHTTNVKQQALLDTEEEAKQFEVDNILPANLTQIQKQTDVAERGMVEQELTGDKQRSLIDIDMAIKNYENTVLQVDQHNKALDDLLTTGKQRDLVTEQIIEVRERVDMLEQQTLTEVQNTAKAAYEVTTLLPKQAILLDEQKESADAEQALTAQRLLTEAQNTRVVDATADGKEYEVSTLLPDQHETNLKQQTLLNTDNQLKQYQVSNIMPTELKIIEQKVVGKKQSTVVGE